MLKGKQKRYLRSMANSLKAVIFVGKDGVTEQLIHQLLELFDKRELIKGSVSQSSPVNVKEVAPILADKTDSEVAQTIGRKFLLYKRSEKEPVIVLPE